MKPRGEELIANGKDRSSGKDAARTCLALALVLVSSHVLNADIFPAVAQDLPAAREIPTYGGVALIRRQGRDSFLKQFTHRSVRCAVCNLTGRSMPSRATRCPFGHEKHERLRRPRCAEHNKPIVVSSLFQPDIRIDSPV